MTPCGYCDAGVPTVSREVFHIVDVGTAKGEKLVPCARSRNAFQKLQDFCAELDPDEIDGKGMSGGSSR